MVRFGAGSLATLEFVLTWREETAVHEERYLARRVNAWRDIFPPGLAEALEGSEEGERVCLEYDPGQVVSAYNPSRKMTIPRASFALSKVAGREIPAHPGRFYPQGAVHGLPHVYPQNSVPFRLMEVQGDKLVIDCNHPLAERSLSLETGIQFLQEKRSDTGGQLSHWIEEICNYGPGMQAMFPGRAVPFGDAFYSRLDAADDGHFYAEPRLVSHVDGQASRNLQELYGRFLKPGMRVLDIMSSRDSHLPAGLDLEVVGLGMNREELEANPSLSGHVLHDLNRDPTPPEALGKAGPFDAIVCSLSVEYLTRPVAVLESFGALLSPGGVLLVGFSDRWFPDKAIAGWMDLHPFERSGVVLQWIRQAGYRGKAGSVSVRNDWRPREDKHFLETRGVSDPVFLAWAFNE